MEVYLDCIETAAKMLKIKPKELSESLIHKSLRERLLAIDALAMDAGSKLVSCQIIASHVYDWKQTYQP